MKKTFIVKENMDWDEVLADGSIITDISYFLMKYFHGDHIRKSFRITVEELPIQKMDYATAREKAYKTLNKQRGKTEFALPPEHIMRTTEANTSLWVRRFFELIGKYRG
jgi:hypothetical protein